VPAPEFPDGLDWLNVAQPLTLEELKGKVVILDFWTYGCINCMHVIPDLKKLEAEYPEELVVIGVHSAKFENEGDTENIRQIIQRYDREHPIVNDQDFVVWQTWGANAWPTLVIIDPAGNVVGGHSGEGVYELFAPVVESLVQEFDAKGLLDRTPIDLQLETENLPNTVLRFPGKVLSDTERDRIFISDTGNNRILIADPNDSQILDVIGSENPGYLDGGFIDAEFQQPQGLAYDPFTEKLFVADTENHAIRLIDFGSREVTTLAGTGEQSRSYPPAAGEIPEVELNSPWDLELAGDLLYIAMAGSHQIFVLDLDQGYLQPFAGSGREGTLDRSAPLAELAQPSGISLGADNRLYFADSEGSSIRWVSLGSGNPVGTLAGSGESLFDFGDVDGVGTEARLQHPLGVDAVDEILYVADTYNHKIKTIDLYSQEVRTLAGSARGWQDGADPQFYEPGGLDAESGKLYIADTNNHAIRVINLTTNETRTLVLSGIEDFALSTPDPDFFGEVIELESVELASGPGTIEIQLDFPPGYKLNDEAPSSVEWEVQGTGAQLPQTTTPLTGEEFPLNIEVEFQQGKGVLTGDFYLYYCEADQQSLCFFEPVRVTAPYSVSTTGADRLILPYEIPIPK
jgi:thiol-disulfide isomerase/thioredoxin